MRRFHPLKLEWKVDQKTVAPTPLAFLTTKLLNEQFKLKPGNQNYF